MTREQVLMGISLLQSAVLAYCSLQLRCLELPGEMV